MRIVLDSNIYFSAPVFPKRKTASLLERVSKEHTLILSNTIINDLTNPIKRKVPELLPALENFFARLTHEYQIVPKEYIDNLKVEISDPNDKHILATAYFAGADMIITGDGHFFERKYNGLQIVKPSDFNG